MEITHEVVEVAIVDAVVQNSIPGLAGRECRGFTRVSLSKKRRYVQRERLVDLPRQKLFLLSLRKPKLEHHSTKIRYEVIVFSFNSRVFCSKMRSSDICRHRFLILYKNSHKMYYKILVKALYIDLPL